MVNNQSLSSQPFQHFQPFQPFWLSLWHQRFSRLQFHRHIKLYRTACTPCHYFLLPMLLLLFFLLPLFLLFLLFLLSFRLPSICLLSILWNQDLFCLIFLTFLMIPLHLRYELRSCCPECKTKNYPC